ncbi:hypothetical protein [Geodermatophilus sp. SYSU D01176]
MPTLLSLGLLLALLLGGLALIVSGARPAIGEGRAGAHRPRALRRYRAPRPTGATPTGLLVLALGGLATASLTEDARAVAVLGLLAGAGALAGSRLGDLVLGGLGAAAAVVTAAGLLRGGCATGVPAPLRAAALAAVVLAFVAAFAVGNHLPGNRRSTSLAAGGLGLFAVVDVVAFLVSPLGVSVVDSGPAATGVSVVVAGIFGVAAGFAPALVPALLGAGVALAGASAGPLLAGACSPTSLAQLGVAVLFTAVAWPVAALGRRLARA